MIAHGNVQILCGALSDEAAGETASAGIFTRRLLELLGKNEDTSLLRLPLDLEEWSRRLPPNLLEDGVRILEERRVLGARPRKRKRRSQHPKL